MPKSDAKLNRVATADRKIKVVPKKTVDIAESSSDDGIIVVQRKKYLVERERSGDNPIETTK